MGELTERLSQSSSAAAHSAASRQASYLDTKGAAERLGVTPRTMETLRARGGGPRYTRVGRVCRYREDWLDGWAEENSCTATHEEAAKRRA